MTRAEQGSGSCDMSHDRNESLEFKVRLLKDDLYGLGINIVESSVGVANSSRIVIESVVKGGPADSGGALQRGMATWGVGRALPANNKTPPLSLPPLADISQIN